MRQKTPVKAVEGGDVYEEAQAESIVNYDMSKRNIWNSSCFQAIFK
jgi:hypothetical protein